MLSLVAYAFLVEYLGPIDETSTIQKPSAMCCLYYNNYLSFYIFATKNDRGRIKNVFYI